MTKTAIEAEENAARIWCAEILNESLIGAGGVAKRWAEIGTAALLSSREPEMSNDEKMEACHAADGYEDGDGFFVCKVDGEEYISCDTCPLIW